MRRIKKKEKRKEKKTKRPKSYGKESSYKNQDISEDKKAAEYNNTRSEGYEKIAAAGSKTKPKLYNHRRKLVGSAGHYQGKSEKEKDSSKYQNSESKALPDYKSMKDLFAETFSFGRK